MRICVRVLAAHVRCTVCDDQVSIDQPQHADAYTQRVLQPLVSWWVAHVGPEIVLLEVEADGEVETWWMTDGQL